MSQCLYLIYLFFQFSFVKLKLIYLPINIEPIDEKNFNFTKSFLNRDVTTEIKIGTPSQKITPILSLTKSIFYISDMLYEIKNNSKTYKEIQLMIKPNIGNKVYLSQDTFTFINEKNKDISFNDLPFLLAREINKNTFNNFLGLSPGLSYDNLNENLLITLKKNNITNSRIFTIKFDKYNISKGELIIGGYPSEYDKNYQEKNFQSRKVHVTTYDVAWSLIMNKFYYGNDCIMDKYELEVEFDLNLNGIFAIKSLFDFIDQLYFNQYVNNSQCFFYNVSDRYFYYVCDKTIDVTQFKDIKFLCKDMNYTFVINLKELYEEINGLYYFMVFYDKLLPYKWTLGIPFLRKYQMVFNQDKKIIGFYTHIGNSINFGNILLYILIIILFLVIVILAFYYYKFFKKKNRKIRSNEIDENYDYISNEKLI